MAKRGLVDKVKRVVARASTRGAMTLVEGTAAAVRTVDKLQEKLASRRKQGKTNTAAEAAPAVSARPVPEAKRTTAPRTNEARANAPRATEARDMGTRAPPRTSGRKTMPGTEAAAKRVKAPTGEAKAEAKAAPAGKKPQQGGFKVKRGQKHPHSRR